MSSKDDIIRKSAGCTQVNWPLVLIPIARYNTILITFGIYLNNISDSNSNNTGTEANATIPDIGKVGPVTATTGAKKNSPVAF